jgi:hypothetical protein
VRRSVLNTLTDLLTTLFPIERLSSILTILKSGAYGIIIDGVDGQFKSNDHAFNAFWDDLMKLYSDSAKTTLVLFGRTQALIDCWVYLQEKSASVGLASIDPFSDDRTVEYIALLNLRR